MSDKPAMKFRIGYLTATVWANDAVNGDRVWYSVELSRTYKEGDDYKTTNALNHTDLLNGARLLQRAEAWIAEQ